MTGARVLVVEDDHTTADLVALYLRHAGHSVHCEHDGAAASARLDREPFDLLVLDVMLPGLDGHALCRQVTGPDGPAVIFLSARTQESHRIAGLDLGADDYLAKPFSPRELVARVQAVLRRRPPRAAPVLVRGPCRIDFARREVTIADRPIALTPSEFAILAALAERPGFVRSRAELLSRLPGDGDEVTERTVDVHIRNLRRKIEPKPSAPSLITTVLGAGYRLDVK